MTGFAVRTRTLITIAMTLVVAATCTLLVASSADAAISNGSTRCGFENGGYGLASAYKCYAPATAYPNQVGPYAWVGNPGTCGIEPYRGYLGNQPTAQCFVSPRYTGWSWTNGAWKSVTLAGGTTGYLYPYAGAPAWRWVYTPRTGWVAVQASDVGIVWTETNAAVAF
ncbi:MAG: hypothetical protein JWM98_2048 [Thermoleophilia bacterium]|nr:hypothetical protein [Thermoleophilia bacterium]